VGDTWLPLQEKKEGGRGGGPAAREWERCDVTKLARETRRAGARAGRGTRFVLVGEGLRANTLLRIDEADLRGYGGREEIG